LLSDLAALPWHGRPPAGWALVALSLWTGRVGPAIARCRKLVAANPDRLDLRARLGVLLVQVPAAASSAEEAVELLAPAVRRDGSNAVLRRWLAEALARAGMTDAAHAHLEAGLRLRPDMPDLWVARGRLLLSQGRTEEALVFIDGALAGRPKSGALWNLRGLCLSELGRHEEAARAYRKAARFLRTDGAVWANLGLALQKTGETAEALRALLHAVRLRPSDPTLLNNVGYTLMRAGRTREAIESYRQASALEPTRRSPWGTWPPPWWRAG
jgi:Flp pilus assembly protein TadD